MSNLVPIPKEWLSKTILQKRIIAHWTVTSYRPDPVSLDSYHFVIDGDGKVHRGNSDLDERAPHTYMFNSAIGISLACMGGYQSDLNPGKYPPTKAQWDALVAAVRQLTAQYGIPVTPQTVLMHGEVAVQLGVDQAGKWDIGLLPHLGVGGPAECGALLRRSVLESSGSLDTKIIPVSIRVSGNPRVVIGRVEDGKTVAPVRELLSSVPEASISNVEITQSGRYVFLAREGEDAIIRSFPLNLYGDVGYCGLREIADFLGWTIEVEQWDKTKRILVFKPKEKKA